MLVPILRAGVGLVNAALRLVPQAEVGFVGLAAPHIARRLAPSAHRPLLLRSAAAGGALLLWADVLARALIAPQELPVGVVTAVIGGAYLFVLIRHRGLR